MRGALSEESCRRRRRGAIISFVHGERGFVNCLASHRSAATVRYIELESFE